MWQGVAQALPVCYCPTAGLADAAGHPHKLDVPQAFWSPSAHLCFLPPSCHFLLCIYLLCTPSSPPSSLLLFESPTVVSQTRHVLGLRARRKTAFQTPVLGSVGSLTRAGLKQACVHSEDWAAWPEGASVQEKESREALGGVFVRRETQVPTERGHGY